MKLLADMGVSMVTVDALRRAGEEVVHLREQGLMRLPDHEIFVKAIEIGRASCRERVYVLV